MRMFMFLCCLGIFPAVKASLGLINDEEICGIGWRSYDKYCYRIQVAEKTWTESRDECAAGGAELIKLINLPELNFVYNTFVRPLHGPSAWIGLSREGDDFRWQDNSGVTFVNWNSGEPNNYGGKEKCVELYVKSGRWNDIECSKLRPSICKKGFVLRHPDNFVMASISNLDYSLHGHVTGLHNVTNVLECSMICFTTSSCYSFNYEYQPQGVRRCELNNSTRTVSRDSYMKRPGFVYYD